MAYTVPSPNVLLNIGEDRLGHQLIELKTQLVATGLWRVRGSGDGVTFQNTGQTAGVGGSYDVFTGAVKWAPIIYYGMSPTGWANGPAGGMSRANAWFILEEIGSGRCLSVQRFTSSPDQVGAHFFKFSPGGFASTGATNIAPPAAVGASVTITINAFNTYAAYQPPESGPASWLQIGCATAADPGGVCPFYLAVYNRTTGAPVMGMLYESLEETVAGDAHPFVFGAGLWNAGAGVFSMFDTTVYFYGGAAMATRKLSALSCNATIYPNNTPTTAQPIGPDGKWRAIRPPVNDAAATWVGRCRNILAHPINRNYPTTYGVATAAPRLVLGQILVPWVTGVAPQSSP